MDPISIISLIGTLAAKDQLAIVKLLHQYGFGLSSRTAPTEDTKDALTPLHIAVALGHLDIAEYLLRAGVKHLPNGFGYFPLHVACRQRRLENVSLLLDSGADIDIISRSEPQTWSSLGLALSNKHLGIVRYLLSKGCSLANALDGMSALELTCIKDSIDTATLDSLWQARKDKGSTTTSLPNELGSLLLVTCQRNVQADFPDDDRTAATPKVVCLLKYGAPIDYQDVDGGSAMHFLAAENNTGLALIIWKWKPSIDLITTWSDTPLHIAVHYGSVDMVRFLLRNNASVRQKNHNGYTAAEMNFGTVGWDEKPISKETKRTVRGLISDHRKISERRRDQKA